MNLTLIGRLAMAMTLLVLSSMAAHNAAAQETRRQKPEQPQQRNQYRDQADTMLQDTQEKETQSYAGQISQKHGKFYLEQEFHKQPFELTQAWDAKRFLGKKVRITGVLDPEKSILRVIAITAIPGSQPHPAQQPACATPPCPDQQKP